MKTQTELTDQAATVLQEIDEQLASEELESCGQCEGTGCISYNPNLNPSSFPATATAKCNHCNGTGKTSARTVCPKSLRMNKTAIEGLLSESKLTPLTSAKVAAETLTTLITQWNETK